MPQFKDMAVDEQQALVASICDLLVECGLEDYVEPCTYVESVCNLAGSEVETKATLKVHADSGARYIPPSKAEGVAQFNEKVKVLVDGVEGVDVKVFYIIRPGDTVETMKGVVPLGGSDAVDLGHDGKVWCLLFWEKSGDYLLECRRIYSAVVDRLQNQFEKPVDITDDMTQEMLEKLLDRDCWQEVVRVLGVSFDGSQEIAQGIVDECPLKPQIEIFMGNDEIRKAYGAGLTPRLMLVNKEGKIVYLSSPQEKDHLDIFNDVNLLLKGESLPCQPGGETEYELIKFEFPPVFQSVDVKTCLEEIAAFTAETAVELQANDVVKENAGSLQHAVCVMEITTLYSPKTKESKSYYKNHRVLVGPQAAVDAIKPVLEEKLKASCYEVAEQYQGTD